MLAEGAPRTTAGDSSLILGNRGIPRTGTGEARGQERVKKLGRWMELGGWPTRTRREVLGAASLWVSGCGFLTFFCPDFA